MSAAVQNIGLANVAQTNGQFSMQIQGAGDQTFVVEVSTNLIDWVPLMTNSTVGGVFNFVDPNATNAAQFYRVRY